jgi:diaminopimelate epimerase
MHKTWRRELYFQQHSTNAENRKQVHQSNNTMKGIPFSKYQGAGNDFILLDNRSSIWLRWEDTERIRLMCDRRFGIGADGLILLQNRDGYDFEMIYFNADGREGTMCGNGGRCIVAFARQLGIANTACRFLAIDGEHEALADTNDWISLKMSDVHSVEQGEDHYILNTGSPHYVVFVQDLTDIDVVETGQAIRYSDRFRKEGINVNFVEKKQEGLEVATYERGVEDETLSCGTGVTACALAFYLERPAEGRQETPITTKGGSLKVKFTPDNNGGFTDIWLCGPATYVFEGVWPLAQD